MIGLKRKHKDSIIKHIGIGASFDPYIQEEADKKALEGLAGYIADDKDCVSLVLYRSDDDLKFLYPVFNDTPEIALEIMNSLVNGINPVVVGNCAISAICDVVRSVLNLGRDDVVFGNEGHTSYFNTQLKCAKANKDRLDMKKNGLMLFMAGDLPFFYNLGPFLTDRSISDKHAILYLNAFEKIFKEIDPLFQRNYYDSCYDEHGQLLQFKESNILSYTYDVIREITDTVPGIYDERKAGNSSKALLEQIVRKKVLQHPLDLLVVKNTVRRYIKYRKKSDVSYPLPFPTMNRLAHVLVNSTFSRRKAIVKFHDDPFVLRDIDALHDWAYYRAVIERVIVKEGIDGLRNYFPYADELIRINDAMKEAKKYIPWLNNFEENLREKANRLNHKLERIEDYIDLGKYNPEQIRKIKAYRIPMPFNSEGNFIYPPAKGDNIDATIGFLGRYCQRFKDGC